MSLTLCKFNIEVGLKNILMERGLWQPWMQKDDCIDCLCKQLDFLYEKTKLELLLEAYGDIAVLTPKFHCEFSAVERYWAKMKKFVRDHCGENIQSLRQNLINGDNKTVTTENWKNWFRKTKDYIQAYKEGSNNTNEVQKFIKKYKSHRKIAEHQRHVTLS